MALKIDLIAHITGRMTEFSKGQRLIASYILEHYDTAAYMTAYVLGETVGVSESTVVRFATELGFSGYPRLQKAMQELVRSNLTSVQRVDVTRARMRDDEVLEKVMSYDIANLRQTLAELDPAVFEGSVEALVSARRVFIFGAGSCRALANFLAYYLKMLLPDVRLISASGETEMLEEMFPISAEDAIIGISFPRYSARAVKAMHFAHSRGARVIAVTDSTRSPIADFATYLLLAHSDMAALVDSLVAPMSVINALTIAISLRRMDDNRERLSELESLWETYQVYQPTEKPPHGEPI